MFSVDTGKYKQLSSALLQLNASQRHLMYLGNQLSIQTSLNPVYHLLQNLYLLREELDNSILETSRYFQDAALQYEKAERQIQTKSSSIQQLKNHSLTPISSKERSIFQKASGYVKKHEMQVTYRKHTTFNANRTIIDYVKNGICGGIYGGFSALKVQAGKNLKYAQGDVSLAIGTANASLDVKGSLYEKGKFLPSLRVEAEGAAMLAQAKAMINLGNKYLSATGEASLAVGAVSGSAKAVINKEEVTLKAEVGAAAVRGEVKGTFSIFGLKISATGIGELGAAGASAEFSSKKGEFEFGGKASLLAGLGFKIKVTW